MVGSALRTTVTLLFLASLNGRSADTVNQEKFRSAQLSAAGKRLFREARFEEAQAAFSQALDLDRGNVEGHLGMGKIALLFSDSPRAASHYSAAYQIAPRDPDAILAFASVVPGSPAQQTLLRNFLTLATDPRAEDVRARLRVAEQTRTMRLSALSSPSQRYLIPLSSIGMAGVRNAGLVLRATINGGRALKLIVDTGATGIVLNASAGSQVNPQFLGDASLSGYGSAKPGIARIARADSFEAGGLKIANPLLNISATDLTAEADGWIGLDVFSDFLIRMNPRAHTLELTPFLRSAPTPDEVTLSCPGCVRAYRLGNLLLLRATINGRAEGYFILDSGSPYSVVSQKLVAGGGLAATFGGAQGALDVAVPSAPLSIRVGNRSLCAFEYATFDNSELSSRNGTEIAGSIGYSILRNLVLTLDYRNGLVKLGDPDLR